jgi:hypothetical protein
MMPDPHDPVALVHHAAAAGDWLLVYMIAQTVIGDLMPPSAAGDRAYADLVSKLDLSCDATNYHRA